MRKAILLSTFVILFLFVTTPTYAVFSCGNLLVQEGTIAEEILVSCGVPVSKERFFLEKYGDVDKWIYGPDAGYIYVIYLFLGKVVEVEEIQQ